MRGWAALDRVKQHPWGFDELGGVKFLVIAARGCCCGYHRFSKPIEKTGAIMDQGIRSNTALMPSLFQADELAPYNFEENCQRKDRYGPEERLLFAILEDAISCYQAYLFAQKEEERALFVEAERWIFDEGGDFTSFNNICETLKLEPAYMRRGLLAWKESQVEHIRQTASKSRWRTFTHGPRPLSITVKRK
jgi:hypothetical protein